MLMMSKQYPWYMAQMRKIAITHITLGLLWSESFIKTWTEVMYGDD